MGDADEHRATGPERRFGFRRGLIVALLVLVLLCLAVTGLSVLSNLTLPSQARSVDRLSALDKARLAEELHLKRQLGEAVWPDWGLADIPVLLWNRDVSFLIGLGDAPAGWEEVPDDLMEGRPYYRQLTGEHENFAVKVDERWVASMATKQETDLFIREMIQGALPAPIDQIIPYRLLIQPSEVQMSGVLHESFHVFQMEMAPGRLKDAEQAYGDDSAYWAADPAMREAWQEEISLLARALEAKSEAEVNALAGRFLDQRAGRRQDHDLDPALVAYERRIEWLEGLAKYVELEAWRQAAETSGYRPLPEMAEDPDFEGYETFNRRWSQEIGQMKRQATQEGEIRFYYTGMAQARLLDRLLPDWKGRAMVDGVWLEELLQEAIK